MPKPFSQITFDFISSSNEDEAHDSAVKSNGAEPYEENIPPGLKTAEKENLSYKVKKAKRGRRSLKEADIAADLIHIPDDETLFKKQYYAIGEVALMFRENQSLIRFWETEFDILQPRKNKKGDRFFRPVDVKNLVLIYDLLRRRKFTIQGAKDFLKKNNAKNSVGNAEDKFSMIQSLQKIKGFLLELKAGL